MKKANCEEECAQEEERKKKGIPPEIAMK